MKSKLLILISIVSLNGCAFDKEFVVQRVEIPIPIRCKIISPGKPVMPLQEAKKDEANIFVIQQKSLAEIELRKAYELKLEAAIQECNN